ncbi:response regulator transcription factor [Massilia sp. W12]|uniref:response regulator transcription factor n=1 Tax=Massilia sp. W12 TaxID=3126507 RepID=UPI0030D34181
MNQLNQQAAPDATAAQVKHILFISDHAMLCDAVRHSLGTHYRLQCLSRARELEQVWREAGPNLLILHIESGEGREWVECLLQAKRRGTPCLALGSSENLALLRTCIVLGVHGYLSRSDDSLRLQSAVRQVLEGAYLFTPECMLRAFRDQRDAIPLLHASEIRVLDLLLREPDLENMEVAQRVKLSYGRVKNLMTELFAKFGVSRRHQLVFEAQRRGYFPGMPLDKLYQFYGRNGRAARKAEQAG